ncbi:MAG TPA: LapA family protein [Actinomycetes bacterium]|nr:LapA family protein [Actinomycetes bacterium]
MSDQDETPDGGKGLGAGAIASMSGLGVLLVFILQNTEDVRFDFLFLSFTWPLWLYTIVTAFFGALVWFGLGVMRRHRRRKERRSDRRS